MSLRLIDIADGFSSSAIPSDLQVQASAFSNFPNAAAYVAQKGSVASENDIFYNTTTSRVEQFTGGEWVPAFNDFTKVIINLVNDAVLPINLKKDKQSFYIRGDLGDVTLSLKPFGEIEPEDGVEISIIGLDDDKAPIFTHSDVDFGCYMNFEFRKVQKGQFIKFKFNKTMKRFVEIGGNY